MSDIYAVDFESYYDKQVSITTLGPRGYFEHPEFDAYLVSVVGDREGDEWVGNPKDYDWSKLEGKTVLSHNAAFDETLFFVGVEQGWWPSFTPKAWHCTADLMAYLGFPRSLAGAVSYCYGSEVDKSTRTNMGGKRWEDMTPEFKEEVCEYAIKDSVLCVQLWLDYEEHWPESERKISQVNRLIAQRGLPVNPEKIRKSVQHLKEVLWDAEQAIPWSGKSALLSKKAFDEECRRVGIEPPASLSQDDVEFQQWKSSHGDKYLWIPAVSDYRRINAMLKKIESFENGTCYDKNFENPRYYGGLMYAGAHTLRFSGSGGNLNLHNMEQKEKFGVNMRSLIEAPKGKALVPVDLSQIEVRTTCWLATRLMEELGKSWNMLDQIRDSRDIYETFAIHFGLWSLEQGILAEENPALRNSPVKPMTLGCGFGAGAAKLGALFGMSEDEAETAVQTFRRTMGPIVKLWYHYDDGLLAAYQHNKPYQIPLPSGRSMTYRNIKMGMKKVDREDGTSYIQKQILVQRIIHGRKAMVPVWGGVLTENGAQALARDIFADRMLALHDAGHKIILHVHDEALIECDECVAQEVLEEAESIMATPPDWIPDIPMAAEGKIVHEYTK